MADSPQPDVVHGLPEPFKRRAADVRAAVLHRRQQDRAAVAQGAPVAQQAIIRIENSLNGEELLCRVAHVGPTFMGKTQVAVEFIKPSATFSDAAMAAKRSDVLGAKR